MSAVTMLNKQERCRRVPSAVGPVLALAGDTSLFTGIQSLATLVMRAVASVIVFGHTDLPGIGPTGAKLGGVGPSQADLVGAYLQGTSPSYAILAGPHLEGACLSSSGQAGR